MSPLVIKYCELIDMDTIEDISVLKYFLDRIFEEIIKARPFINEADKKKFKAEIALFERVEDTWRHGSAKVDSLERDKHFLPRKKNDDDVSDNVCMTFFT